MSRRGKRQTVAIGIYRDASGFEVRATVGEWEKTHRFPPNATLREMKTWQEDTRARLRHSGVKMTTRGTLAADVDLCIQKIRHLAGWKSVRAELRAWVKLFPDKRRRSIDADDVLHARTVWLAAGVAPLTVVNRESALRRLWHHLDGAKAPTPVDGLPEIPHHKTPPIVIPPTTILRVYQTLRRWRASHRLKHSVTIAQFMVYAACGRRPSEYRRAQRTDLDWHRGVWYPRDGKGGFSPGIYLNEDMLAAWSLFAASNAWGRSFQSLPRTIRAAGWPGAPGEIDPYNLRHTTGITMSEHGTDLADIGAHMGHKRPETTRKFYVPVLNSRLQRASESIDKRFGW